jgi:hypothetical protein
MTMSEPKKKPKRRPRTDKELRQRLMDGASKEARLLASTVLEVLAGSLGPGEAAQLLGCSSPQYYKREARALEGLLRGCEPRARGRQRKPEQELEKLRASHAKLERECARLQALVRALGKTVGRKGQPTTKKSATATSKTVTGKTGKRKQRRRPKVARGLRLAEELKENGAKTEAPVAGPTPPARPVRPPAPSSERVRTERPPKR